MGITGTKTSEYKWLAAISNASSSSYTFGSDDKFRLCTDYWDGFDVKAADTDFDLNNITIPGSSTGNAGMIFIGFESDGDGFTHSMSVTIAAVSGEGLADQKDGTNIIASSRFRLKVGGIWTDVVFDNSIITNSIHFNPGAFHYIYETASSYTVNSSLRKKFDTDNPPEPCTNWDPDEDWIVSEGTSYLSASAAGDPHICTLFGEHYEFDHLGAIRLFDNQHARSGKDNDLIIINGLVEPGPGRWAKNQYIQKLFVYNAGKTMVVNLGFRGSKVVVEHNDGIPYEEEELGFHDDALMHAFEGMASFKDPEKAKEYAELHGVLVPPLVRNQLTFELCGSEEDTAAHKVELTVTLSNVNKYNLQPCRINIDTGNDFNKKLATGCLMHRKYATHCALDNLTNIDDLPEPTKEEMKNMPELEIKPMLRNVQWQ